LNNSPNINIILKGNLPEQQPLSVHIKVRQNNIKVYHERTHYDAWDLIQLGHDQ